MGAATYRKGMPKVWLRRVSEPTLPCNAAANSVRREWFSMVLASASESASTLPSVSMIVARAPAALPSRAAMSCKECWRSVCTRLANITTFCVRLRWISSVSDFSQARRMEKSSVAVAAAITTIKAASSLKKMRLVTSVPRSDSLRRVRFSDSAGFPGQARFSREYGARRRPPSEV